MLDGTLLLLAGKFGKIEYERTDIPLTTALYGYALHKGRVEAAAEGRVSEVSAKP